MRNLFAVWVLFAFFQMGLCGVTPEDWAFKPAPEKGIEHAVVLCQEGLLDETFTNELSIQRFDVKMKFFTRKGIEDYGTVKLVFDPEEENISDIKAVIFLPDGEKVKLTKKDIHKKKVSREWGQKETEISFAFPGLTEGCIVEYSYSRSFYGANAINRWQFQDELFVVKSEVTYVPWPGNAWGYNILSPLGQPEITESRYKNNRSVVAVRENIPPYETEPHGLPEAAVAESIVFYYFDTSSRFKDYWPQRGQEYYKTYLKSRLKPCRQAEKIVASMNLDENDPDACIKALYDHVISNHVCLASTTPAEKEEVDDGTIKKIIAANRVSEMFDLKYLYRDQINYVLASLITAAIPHAKLEYAKYIPWHSGVFNPYTKTLRQFQQSMLRVTVEDREYWLSPRQRYLPVNCVPWGARGCQLLIIGPDKTYFHQLPARDPEANTSKVEVKLVMDEDGVVHITRTHIMNPHESYRIRAALAWFEEEEFRDLVEELLESEFGSEALLEDFSLDNLHDLSQPISLTIMGTFSHAWNEVGDQILLPVIGLDALKTNPFLADTRKQNIFFHYPYLEERRIQVTLPDLFAVRSVPEPQRLEDNALLYDLEFTQEGEHAFSLVQTKALKANMFSSQASAYLRKLFSKMLSAQRQNVVLEEL